MSEMPLIKDSESDKSIIVMLDSMFADDELYIFSHSENYLLCVKASREGSPDYYEIIETYKSRSLAYRGGIDYLIGLSVFADDGGEL